MTIFGGKIVRKSYKAVLVTVLSLILLTGTVGIASARPYRRGAIWWAVSHQTEIVHLHSHAVALRIVHSGPMPFTDVPGWAQQAVNKMYGLGIVQGFPGGLFHPNQVITRAQLAAILVREFGISTTSGVNTRSFADVQPGFWAYQDIEAASPYMDYFTSPDGQAVFEPNKPAAREDAFVALVEAAGLAGQTPNPAVLSKFADVGSISPNLTNLVAIAVQNNLVTGSQNQSGAWYLYPQQSLSRAQAAALFYRGLRYTEVAPGTSGTNGPVSPSSTLSSIQVSAAQTAITVGQTAQVSATVVNTQGQPMADTPVTFSVSSASGSAAVSPQSAVTNSQGQAFASVNDQTAETVTVTASASGVSGSTGIQFNAPSPAAVQVATVSGTVYAGQTDQVTATITNSQGQPMAGIQVGFSVTGPATVNPQSAVTDSQGQAFTTISDQTAETVTVTAVASGISGSANVQFIAAGS